MVIATSSAKTPGPGESEFKSFRDLTNEKGDYYDKKKNEVGMSTEKRKKENEVVLLSSPKRKNEGGKDEGVLSILFPRKDNVNKRQMSFIDYINEIYAWTMGILIILTFGCGALLNVTMFFLFRYTIPKIWYKYRILAVRGNWSLVVLALRISNVNIAITGDKSANQHMNKTGPRGWYAACTDPKKYMVMMNHLSWADSFVVATWIYGHNSAGGDTLWPVWKSFLYIPIGWFAYTTAQVFMGFGAEKDLKLIEERITNFYERGFSKFFIFPEGGIFRNLLKEKSHKYAKSKGFPLLEHCLLPREKAFHVAAKKLHQEYGMEDLYDLTLGYPKGTPLYNDPFDILDLIRIHKKPRYIYLNVRKLALKDINLSSSDTTREYLFERFKEKDKMMDDFYQQKGELWGYGSTPIREEKASIFYTLLDYICWATILFLTVKGYIHLIYILVQFIWNLF